MSELIPAKPFLKILGLLFLLAASSEAAVNDQIEMFLETPAPGQTISGVLFTRGWAVAPDGIARVELYIDGSFLLEIPLGESRPEVGDMFTSFPDSDIAGFNIGLFYSRFANGPHTATVRAIDTNGDYKEVSNSFTITRFDTRAPNNFLRDPSKVDLTSATVSLDGNTILINGMIVDGAVYTVRVEWNTTLQGLAISQITSSQFTKTSSPAHTPIVPPSESKAAVNQHIEMFLETPAPNQTITGVLFTRGWAVAPAGIARTELYVDGNFMLEIPLGESRPDIGSLFPSFPGSDTSGFNIGLFYSRFSSGPHTATVRAIDTNGDYKEVSNSFAITRFDTRAPNNFLRDPSKIDFTSATVSLDGNTILIHGMIVDGIVYPARVEWNTTLQGLSISQIACDFSQDEGHEVCFSGIGKGCNGVLDDLIVPFEPDNQKCLVEGWISVGSIRHDRCCYDSDNLGYMCDNNPNPVLSACKEQWDQVWNDVFCSRLHTKYPQPLRAWQYTFGPYKIGDKGDDVTQPMQAPDGARVNPAYESFCLSRKCISDGQGQTIVKSDECGEYCVCGVNPCANQAPSRPVNPSPADNASDVGLNTNLSWQNGSCADTYDIYFGNDSSPDSSEFKGNQSATTYNPGTLGYDTTYYWRIDTVNPQGTTTGSIWKFTTPPDPASPPNVRQCEIVASVQNSSFYMKVANGLGVAIDVFLPKYAFSAYMRPGECVMFGLKNLTKVVVTRCDSGDYTTCSGATKTISVSPTHGNTYILDVSPGYFRHFE